MSKKYYCAFQIGESYFLGLGRKIQKAKKDIYKKFIFLKNISLPVKFKTRILLNHSDIRE